jgi:hypothetical protein
VRAAGATLAVIPVLVLAAVASVAIVAVGADPSAAPGEVLTGGDPRSEGEGPGLVGSPLLILAAVVALGLATALLTIVIVRVTQRD